MSKTSGGTSAIRRAVIFSDTTFNNVTFWNKPMPEEQQRHYGKQRTEAADFHRSGLYKDVNILLMDEVTSALNSETEKAIQKSIEDHAQKKVARTVSEYMDNA